MMDNGSAWTRLWGSAEAIVREYKAQQAQSMRIVADGRTVVHAYVLPPPTPEFSSADFVRGLAWRLNALHRMSRRIEVMLNPTENIVAKLEPTFTFHGWV